MDFSNSNDRFNPIWLVTFYWVCRLGSKERAARKLSVTPKTVAYRIAELEHSWGKKLLKSVRWVGSQTTPFGRTLFKLARSEHQLLEDQRKKMIQRFLDIDTQESDDESQ